MRRPSARKEKNASLPPDPTTTLKFRNGTSPKLSNRKTFHQEGKKFILKKQTWALFDKIGFGPAWPPSSIGVALQSHTLSPESDEVAATASVAGLEFGGGDLVATYLDDPGLGSPWRAPTSAETSMLLVPVPDSSADPEPQE